MGVSGAPPRVGGRIKTGARACKQEKEREMRSVFSRKGPTSARESNATLRLSFSLYARDTRTHTHVLYLSLSLSLALSDCCGMYEFLPWYALALVCCGQCQKYSARLTVCTDENRVVCTYSF